MAYFTTYCATGMHSFMVIKRIELGSFVIASFLDAIIVMPSKPFQGRAHFFFESEAYQHRCCYLKLVIRTKVTAVIEIAAKAIVVELTATVASFHLT